MKNTGFDKALFKSAVTFNVKNMFRRTIDEATPQQIFQAVAYTVKDDIIDQWITTHKEYEKKDVKTLYYLSMEFLMGRALGNNMINLREYKEIAEALDEMGFDLNAIEDQEPDAALGNGGLGRLAACFLDSLATLGYPAYGCGIRYRYGMFKQKIEDGYQLPNLDLLAPGALGVVRSLKEAQMVEAATKDFQIKMPNAEVDAASLSGGNQQKVVVSKWLARNSRVVIFDEPTRGIDVAAKVEIYNIMNRLKKKGIAVIFVSSEMPEILGMSDRIIVMCDGRITGEMDIHEATQEKIMHYATQFENKLAQ